MQRKSWGLLYHQRSFRSQIFEIFIPKLEDVDRTYGNSLINYTGKKRRSAFQIPSSHRLQSYLRLDWLGSYPVRVYVCVYECVYTCACVYVYVCVRVCIHLQWVDSATITRNMYELCMWCMHVQQRNCSTTWLIVGIPTYLPLMLTLSSLVRVHLKQSHPYSSSIRSW